MRTAKQIIVMVILCSALLLSCKKRKVTIPPVGTVHLQGRVLDVKDSLPVTNAHVRITTDTVSGLCLFCYRPRVVFADVRTDNQGYFNIDFSANEKYKYTIDFNTSGDYRSLPVNIDIADQDIHIYLKR